MQDHTYLTRIKGSQPVQFMFITMDADFSGIKHTSHAMSEAELREFFRENGRPDLTQGEIESTIANAKEV